MNYGKDYSGVEEDTLFTKEDLEENGWGLYGLEPKKCNEGEYDMTFKYELTIKGYYSIPKFDRINIFINLLINLNKEDMAPALEGYTAFVEFFEEFNKRN